MSFLSFLENEKEEVSLLLDIGNGSIIGSFVLFSKSSIPKFLYTVKVGYTVSDEFEKEKMILNMLAALDMTLDLLIKETSNILYWKKQDKKIAHVMISYSSPWFMSKTEHVSLSEETPFIVSNSFLDSVVQKEEENFAKDLKNNNNFKDDSFEVIEKSIVHTKINGYMLDKSIGRKTKTLDAYVFLSVVSEDLIQRTSNVILKYTHIPREKIIFHSFPLVSFTVLRDIFSASSDFMMIDVTGEVVDITLVKDDIIFGTATIPSGKNFIVREIAKAFNVPKEIAVSTLHLYTSERMDTKSGEIMEEVLTNIEKEWSIYFENALLELSGLAQLPSSVYMTADNDVANIYKKFLKFDKVDTTSLFRKNMKLIQIQKDSLSTFYINESPTGVDEFISLLTIFYNKIMRNQ